MLDLAEKVWCTRSSLFASSINDEGEKFYNNVTKLILKLKTMERKFDYK
jgi:hypothetical protein